MSCSFAHDMASSFVDGLACYGVIGVVVCYVCVVASNFLFLKDFQCVLS